MKATCHVSRKHYAKGLCAQCYRNTPQQVSRSRKYAVKWRTDFRKRVGEARYSKWLFKRNLFSNYRLSLFDYEKLLRKQNYRCPCGERLRTPNVDHNHDCCSGRKSCGKCIRGLLCRRCNLVLGLLGENRKLLPEYLRKYLCI